MTPRSGRRRPSPAEATVAASKAGPAGRSLPQGGGSSRCTIGLAPSGGGKARRTAPSTEEVKEGVGERVLEGTPAEGRQQDPAKGHDGDRPGELAGHP